ncbi:MAG TPA: KH domain-containing protein, partial [Vicinamibacterales bacterium]
MIVMKFGGTSVGDRAAIERVVSIVRAARQVAIQPESQDWRGPVVVVSALSGATDRLLGIAAQAGAGDIEGARDHLRALGARHRDVAGIVTQAEERREVDRFIDESFGELERIVGALGVSCTIRIDEREDAIEATIEGPSLGLLIGRHGQTIDALQYLANAIAHRDRGLERKSVTVDASGYRARRASALEAIARRAAEQASATGRPVALEPMTAVER